MWCVVIGLPDFGYSYGAELRENEARASGRDLRVSFKEMVELARAIKGMKLSEAKALLEEVIAMKRPIPFKRYKKGVGHRKQLSGWKIGRYPVKASKLMLKILTNAEYNAIQKGLDADSLYIKHVAAQQGPKLRRIFYRAMGRATPRIEQLTHVEVVVEERG
ncbi:50S ribosomal protein L22 [Candidatus Methanodesulfokora washburnensis]|jgi:large subunit ribosomal protein L22|uniref:Large ribosomal subunit protein uL22 n=1 Tax=Candidatus Methanodesulfokora washburnensis TaxID=2478471 RepID=A0A3R9PY83_9CREN|nr:50S ribosomal protein L22 [Candidatus Methanodesulfokores washburnensis]